MATAQKKSTGGKRTQSASRSNSRSVAPSRSSRGKAPQPQPVRREVGAVVCLLLAIFSTFGYFNVQALFIDFFCGTVKGLIGYGFWLLPPMLLVASGVLIFHRGRPVRLRVWCAMLTPVLLGCFFHLILSKSTYEWSLALPGLLWTDGKALTGGGVISGFISLTFTAVFSKIGAGIVFLIIGGLMVMATFSVSIVEIVDRLRDFQFATYEEQEIPERRPKERRPAPQPVPRSAPAPARRSKPVIDIPVDDGPLPQEVVEQEPAPKKGFFNRKSNVPTPDQILAAAPSVQPVTLAAPPPTVSQEPVSPAPAAECLPPYVDALRDEDELFDEVFDEPEPIPFQTQNQGVSPVIEIVREPAVPKASPESLAPREAAPVEAVAAPIPKGKGAETAQAAAEISREVERSLGAGAPPDYQYPPASLLREGVDIGSGDVAAELRANQIRLSDTIRSFGIDATIADVTRGPSVTRYEVELDQGVRLNKLTNLSDDIALALGATGVRIAPVPDKISMVGIEVPNKLVSPVHIHAVIDSAEFRNHSSKVCFSVGKDIGGNCIVGNIAKLPHLLIAGTTGSGKSVCTNSLIISLLYKATPEEVRLIMVDPKMVELGIYNGIPHLLIPVVTDPKKAAGALQWAVTEMMKRYRSFAEVGVRDLASYNALATRTEGMRKMPQIVVVIDELADLMLVAAKEVEESICRVAQMGRASGMHLIIATQRPSADVITGLMKANIPSRIAFAVASSLESRIILDTTGAEKLVGRGDMLYFPLGTGKPQRVQGCLISDEEVAAVVEFVKRSGSAEYDEAVLHEIEKNAAEKEKGSKGVGGSAPDEVGNDYDDLLPAAIEVVVDTGQASVSMLQRRLKLGYSRAARLVDQMEEKGVVGPFEGSKPRQLLITREQWLQMQHRQSLVTKANDDVPSAGYVDAAAAAPAGGLPTSAPVPGTFEGEADQPPFDMEED